MAAELGVSVSRVRQLADEGAIRVTRTEGGHRLFDLGLIREALARRSLGGVQPRRRPSPTWARMLAIPGLAEDQVWRDLVRDLDHASQPLTPAKQTMRYAFTEMLNNAIDHSGGTDVQIEWWEDADKLAFEIRDNGQGIFSHVRDGLSLEDHFAAIQELSKGKTTTNPQEHTGEGIFFTSKAVDIFEIASNGWRWTIDNLRGDQAVGAEPAKPGTTVSCEIDAATTRHLDQVFDAFTDEDHSFSRSHEDHANPYEPSGGSHGSTGPPPPPQRTHARRVVGAGRTPAAHQAGPIRGRASIRAVSGQRVTLSATSPPAPSSCGARRPPHLVVDPVPEVLARSAANRSWNDPFSIRGAEVGTPAGVDTPAP